jgi:hypothetical protein
MALFRGMALPIFNLIPLQWPCENERQNRNPLDFHIGNSKRQSIWLLTLNVLCWQPHHLNMEDYCKCYEHANALSTWRFEQQCPGVVFSPRVPPIIAYDRTIISTSKPVVSHIASSWCRHSNHHQSTKLTTARDTCCWHRHPRNISV